MSTTTDTIQIRFGTACGLKECAEFGGTLYTQLTSGRYDRMAAMGLPWTREMWEKDHRTARKRAWQAERYGYLAARVSRKEFEDDIYAINISRTHRQGRPMAPNYLKRPKYGDDFYPCREHGIHAYGVLDGHGTLVAYLWMYRAGDLALVSQVLGHAAHEEFGVMYLLFREALAAEGGISPGVCLYNRYDSGTDGLRFLKDRVGFREQPVEWLP